MAGFEPLRKPSFRLEAHQGSERIVIPARKNWSALPFLGIWLIGWTAGGITMISDATSGGGDFDLLLFLLPWLLGWLFAAIWISWQLSGKEFLAVEGGALVRGWSVLGLGRSKRYDLNHVADVEGATPPFPYGMMRVSYPPFLPAFFGSVKWNYGPATIYAASGLSEAEGKMIAERLRARMPARLRG